MTVNELLRIKVYSQLCGLTSRCRFRKLNLRFYTRLHAIEDGY
ncbi:MAG TPA: hypothetical protein VGG75_38645 [Trebonia sp.]|jgi:hypothetical protein